MYSIMCLSITLYLTISYYYLLLLLLSACTLRLSDFWGFLCIIGESLPYDMKHSEASVVLTWCYISKLEVN